MAIKVTKLHSFTGHRDAVYTLQGTDQPNRFGTGSRAGVVVFWDLQTPDDGYPVARLPSSIYPLDYRAPSSTLFVRHNYEGIHVLDLTNKSELASLQLTKAAIFDLQSVDNLIF